MSRLSSQSRPMSLDTINRTRKRFAGADTESELRSVTVEKLVTHCIESFESDSAPLKHNQLPNVLFFTHKWFMQSEHLAQLFVSAYQGCAEGCFDGGTIKCPPGCEHHPPSFLYPSSRKPEMFQSTEELVSQTWSNSDEVNNNEALDAFLSSRPRHFVSRHSNPGYVPAPRLNRRKVRRCESESRQLLIDTSVLKYRDVTTPVTSHSEKAISSLNLEVDTRQESSSLASSIASSPVSLEFPHEFVESEGASKSSLDDVEFTEKAVSTTPQNSTPRVISPSVGDSTPNHTSDNLTPMRVDRALVISTSTENSSSAEIIFADHSSSGFDDINRASPHDRPHRENATISGDNGSSNSETNLADQRDIVCERCLKQQKICQALRYWINEFPLHFDRQSDMPVMIHSLRRVLEADGQTACVPLLDTSKIPSYEWMRNKMSVRHSHPPTQTNSSVSLVFDKISAIDLADQITYIEWRALRRIPSIHRTTQFSEYKSYAKHPSLRECPKLERSIAMFNGLSQWIQCMVLQRTLPLERSLVITKFVAVAQRLLSVNNFNSMMAVVGSLTHSTIDRLSKTKKCLSSQTIREINNLSELISNANNYAIYRKKLSACSKGFRIPIIGIHLRDLVQANAAIPDDGRSPNEINFLKMVQLSAIFNDLLHLQDSQCPVIGNVNMDVVSTIRLALDMNLKEEDLYELSLAREPRVSIGSTSSTTSAPALSAVQRSSVFAEWISGLSPPDPSRVSQHVHNMVEAVFKNYDHDRDGYISRDEFEAITSNFPFIDNFYVLDVDNDGMISKSEMKEYFVRANSIALRNSFKHQFCETTYFKLVYCVHCTGVLWGLIKQGYKCKDCGINSHKQCKDQVVMECKKRTRGSVDSTPTSPTLRSNRNGRKRRVITSAVTIATTSSQTQTDSGAYSSVENLLLPDEPRMSCGYEGDREGSFESLVDGPRSGEQASDQLATSQASISVFGDDEATDTRDADATDTPATPQLTERVRALEAELESLRADNTALKHRLESASEQIDVLQSHNANLKQHTVSFILGQMEALHLQKDSPV